MKRVASISGREGTDNGETGLLVEQGVAYDKNRTTSLLLVTGLGIEGNGNERTLSLTKPLCLLACPNPFLRLCSPWVCVTRGLPDSSYRERVSLAL